MNLYRDAANVLRTDDALRVGELRVDTAGRANSRNQLGLDLGTSAGNIVALNSDGRFDAERITEPFDDVAYSGTITWNLEANPNGVLTLTGDATLSISGDIDGGVYTLLVIQDSTGGHTLTLPSGWKWAGGTADTFPEAANDNTVLTIRRIDSDIVAAPLLKSVA